MDLVGIFNSSFVKLSDLDIFFTNNYKVVILSNVSDSKWINAIILT